MMGDDRISDHPKSTEFLHLYLGDNLQPSPGVSLEPAGQPESHGLCPEQTWAFDVPESGKQDTPTLLESEPSLLDTWSFQGGHQQRTTPPRSPGDSHSLGSPQPNQNSSAQVMFWAGILQAQMCVLDLEEELEKTEGLRAELRCCVPISPVDLPTFPTNPASPKDSGCQSRSPLTEKDAGEDSSESEGESTTWPRERTPSSSLEWDAEESLFFNNPLFVESPCSETSASGECFSWITPDILEDERTRPETLEAQRAPPPAGGVPREPRRELDLRENTDDSSGHTTPPFPVPVYRVHSLSWATEGATEGACAGLLGQAASEIMPCPEGCQPEEGSSRPQVLLQPQDRGGSDANAEQDPSACTLDPGPWDAPASSPELSSPESESRDPGPWPSPVSSQEGSPQLPRHCSDNTSPRWTLDASHLSLLETDRAESSSLEKEEAMGTPCPGEELKSEKTVRAEEAGAAQLDIHSTCKEGLPESPMPQAPSAEDDQRPETGNKLANGVGTDKLAWNLASRLYHLEGFRKSEVAAYLQKNNDFSRTVAEKYLSFFQLGGQSLDRALRSFLQALVLSGETQERERILYQFSKRFHHCNPGVFPSVDSVHTLTCAIMLLNSDLHGQNIGKSMSCQEFITNLNGLQDGGNFSKELLKALYWSIRSEKLEWAVDEEDAARSEKSRPVLPVGKMSSPFFQLLQDPSVPTYKQGILARKMHHDADGKKTPWGKRGWKMFHTLLRGMVLYFLKGESYPEGENLVGQMVDEPVGVHHSLATPATYYTKKPHVFQLRTADWRLYLFQAPTAKEMSSWISRINLAAATHSAPPFPAAVGSQRRFVRPILPMGLAQNSLEEQHRSHENCLDATFDDLLDLQRNLPERRGRGRELEEYRLRKEYLEYEKTRYETYVQLLVARLHCPSEDLDPWEEQLRKEDEGTREPKPSLKKSHSSPSLHQDEAPTTAKVKRNISERRTYRKIIPKRNRNQL